MSDASVPNNVGLVQILFPGLKVSNVQNWLDLIGAQLKTAVFLVDFMDFRDKAVSQECTHLFTCAYNGQKAYNLGHRSVYAGAGLCEVSSLLPKTWFTRTLMLGVFWTSTNISNTRTVCAAMARDIFAPESQKEQYLIPITIKSERIPFFTLMVIATVIVFICVVIGFIFVAHIFMLNNSLQKFTILASLDRYLTNYHYSKFIVSQKLLGDKDIRLIYESARLQPYKYKSITSFNQQPMWKVLRPHNMLLSQMSHIRGPSSLERMRRFASSENKLFSLTQKPLPRRQWFVTNTSRDSETGRLSTVFSVYHSSTSSLNSEMGQRKAREQPTITEQAGAETQVQSQPQVQAEEQKQTKLEALKQTPKPDEHGHTISTFDASLSKHFGSMGSFSEHDAYVTQDSDISIIDNITFLEQRRICGYLPRMQNIVQSLPDELRYVTNFSIANKLPLKNSPVSEICTYNGKKVLFSYVLMPVWSSATMFSSALKLQRRCDANKGLFSTIEGVFIFVWDRISGRRYTLSKDAVSICAFDRNSSFYFCMITNLGKYEPLKMFAQSTRAWMHKGGLSAASFSHNINFVREVLESCGRIIKARKEDGSLIKNSTGYSRSVMSLNVEPAQQASGQFFSAGSSFHQFIFDKPQHHMSFSQNSGEQELCPVPSVKKLQKMSTQSLMDLFKSQYFLMSDQRTSRFTTLLHALNAQRPGRQVDFTFLAERHRGDMSITDLAQRSHDNNDNEHSRTGKILKTGGRSNVRTVVLYKYKQGSYLHGEVDRYIRDVFAVHNSSNMNSNIETALPSGALTCLQSAEHSTENSSDDGDYNDMALMDYSASDLIHRIEDYLHPEYVNAISQAQAQGHRSKRHIRLIHMSGVETPENLRWPNVPRSASPVTYEKAVDRLALGSHTLTDGTQGSINCGGDSGRRSPLPPPVPSRGTLNYRLFSDNSRDDSSLDTEGHEYVYEILACLGSSTREHVARAIMKGLASRASYVKKLRYFDKDCILININPILGNTVDAEISFKLEPFSILLRLMNLVPLHILVRTDYRTNSADKDTYARLVLIYLELITLLDCTQGDIEDLAGLLSEYKVSVNYGDAMRLLLPLIKGFATLSSEQGSAREEDEKQWTNYLFKTFLQAKD